MSRWLEEITELLEAIIESNNPKSPPLLPAVITTPVYEVGGGISPTTADKIDAADYFEAKMRLYYPVYNTQVVVELLDIKDNAKTTL